MFVRLCFLDVFSRSNVFLETSLQWRTALLTAVGSMLINWQQAQRMQTQSRQQNFLTIVSLSFRSTASCHKHLFFKAHRNAEARVHETYLWIIWTRQSIIVKEWFLLYINFCLSWLVRVSYSVRTLSVIGAQRHDARQKYCDSWWLTDEAKHRLSK